MEERKPGDFSGLKPDEWTPLTESQIQNWRNILLGQIGPYANIMPVEEIEQIRRNIQNHANENSKAQNKTECG